ncbi:MAG: Smr/MutS family protein [Fidelibacterota bacterium]|nr:MAG: Smr/MutS family protein [Candidatus Neomarinimicrobiota bacterium]
MSTSSSSETWDESLGSLLHFNQVLQSVGELCVTSVARDYISSLWPITDPERLSERYTATAELLTMLEKKTPPPLAHFSDVRPALQRLMRGASALTPTEFHELRIVLTLFKPLSTFFQDQPNTPFWSSTTYELNPWPEGVTAINRVVDDDQTIKSSASKELQRLRAAIHRTEEQARRRLEELHGQAQQSGWAQDEPIAWREGRLVIALKATHKRKLRGLMHGHSGSGATVFVEPLEVFDLNNELAALRDEEKAEELRLLAVLTEALLPHADDVRQGVEVLYRLDAHLAQARWADQQEAVQPQLSASGAFELLGARNPILAAHRDVVPLDVRLGDPERLLLISGPNAGGKTVVLLTVGLFVMLAQSGLFVPAKQAILPLFNSLNTDLGDRQSLEDDLSTFSAHLANLQSILSRCGHASLVLLDELGTGTEPEAGAALGQTFLEAIREQGAVCLATTHLNRLKLWAQDEPGILNAGMAFDAQELCPTYRLEIGRPGASFALEIARRMGLDDQLLHRAQTLMPDAAVNLEELLVSLEEDRADIQRLKAELQDQLQDVQERERQLSSREADIKAAHRRAHKDALREAEQLVADMNRRLENTIAEVRRKGETISKEDIRAAKQAIARERRQLAAQQEQLAEDEPAALSMEDIQTGMWVTLKDQARPARVVKRYPGRQRVTLDVEGMRVTLPIDQLAPGKEPPDITSTPPGGMTTVVGVTAAGGAGYRLDLRGQRGDEAVAAVDRFLDRALLAGLAAVEIIHGKGTGALQKRVREFLESHPRVKSFRFADFDAGGTGVTLVELK